MGLRIANWRRAAVILAGVLLALVLAVWTGHRQQGPRSCSFTARGADIQVLTTGWDSCAQPQAQLGASDGLAWYPVASIAGEGQPGPDGQPLYAACSLTGGDARLLVMDAAQGGYGSHLCDAARAIGWHG